VNFSQKPSPQNLLRLKKHQGDKYLSHGKKPSYFPLNPDCLIKILTYTIVHYLQSPYNWVGFHPQYNILNNHGLFSLRPTLRFPTRCDCEIYPILHWCCETFVSPPGSDKSQRRPIKGNVFFLLPEKLTCPLKTNGWKMYFLLK